MKKNILISFMTLIVSATAFAESGYTKNSAQMVLHYNVPVTLIGTVDMVRSRHPNPYFRGEKQPAILLDTPITVKRDIEDETTVTERNVRLIQTMTGGNPKLHDLLLRNIGRKIKINCTDLFHEMTGHHSTKVLCLIKSISFEK